MLVILLEYSKYPLQRFFLIQNMRWHGLNIEVKSCVFEYSWSDLMGILNIQKVPSWVILNIHEAKSWVLWIFMKWRHGHFECSKADIKCKYEMTSWVFWILKADFMDILNIYEVTLVFWIQSDAMGILNIHSDIFNIHSKLRRFLNIHSIKYQCHYEYSKTHDARF